jgi:hypothetical protein
MHVISQLTANIAKKHLANNFNSVCSHFLSSVCPVNAQDYILGDRAILPFENIMTPSEDSSNNPTSGFVDTGSTPWCTAQNEGAAQLGRHVELTFTESIVVEFFKSEGMINTWISNFSIQYSLTESGDNFTRYGVLEPSQVNIISLHKALLFPRIKCTKPATIS